MRGSINVFTIVSETLFVNSPPAIGGIYPRRKNGYNKGSPSAEVAELADA